MGMDSLPIAVPVAPAAARRPPIPFVAALVPVAGGVVLWLVTGSLFSLCFAALGPLMVVASLIDGARSRRRAQREAEEHAAEAWSQAESQLARLHDEERRIRWHRHPDAAACLAQPPLRGPDAPDSRTEIVVGTGRGTSAVRASGGDGERERDFRERCAALEGVPLTVPIGGGVALRGAYPVVASAARALIVQMCLRFSASQLTVVGGRLEHWGVAELPQARAARRGAFRLGVAQAGVSRPVADAVIVLLARDDEVPEGITTVIDIMEPRRATLRTPQGIVEMEVECMSHGQAVAVALARAGDAEALESLPSGVALCDLTQPGSGSGLAATIGRGERDEIVLDIVDDGPHAVVTGTTGTGKSELLVSWVTAISSSHSPDRVLFVLADFKGGTAFEPLRMLPHVVAVITDLDDEGARRGVSSLTAELRRRESVLAAAGARDVSESEMPRLIIVVDEFAALLQEHPDLGAVFTDIAARGRALGMHLILGTQRASGVIRDALAANCPLRISLRVGEASDSRVVIGTDAAADLPGGVEARGLALARRPQDSEPVAMRVALTSAADLRAIAVQWEHVDVPQSPWLPALPRVLPLTVLRNDANHGEVVLGRADEPERQRQPLETLSIGEERGIALLGASGSGRTSALRALMKQHQDALLLPVDSELAWDAVTDLADGRTRPALVLCDDIDAQINDLPVEYAQHLAQLWEQIIRGAAGTTFVLTATRSAGAVGRLLDALPRRGLLRMQSRVDHLAAGGDSGGFERDRPPGRMRVDDREVQLAWVPEDRLRSAHLHRTTSPGGAQQAWSPRAAVTALVTPGVSTVAGAVADAYPGCDVIPLSADLLQVPEQSGRSVILLGEPDAWQRHWTLWQRVRREGEVLVRAEHISELRQLAGVRQLPPYARSHAGRAWSLIGDSGPRRVVIPALTPGR